MKIHNQDIDELIFFKKLAATNRLDQLILNEQEPYPPPQYTANQIYSSQYATALHTIKEEGLINPPNENNQDKSESSSIPKTTPSLKRKCKHLTHHPSVKYPLPLAFAYFQSYGQERLHEKAINVLKNHLQRKNAYNQHIIYYNLSCLYREKRDSKKAIFYLQSVLKEKPFFEFAVIDYAFLLSMNNRCHEALQILKRHLIPTYPNPHSKSPLAQSSSLQSIFLNLAYRNKTVNEKQVIKIFNNRVVGVQVFFNLGLYFKKMKALEKAEQIFITIIQQLDESFEQKKTDNSSFQFVQKDQKIYFYSKINLYEVYYQMASQNLQEKENSEKQKINRAYKYKALKALDSLVNTQNEASDKFFLYYVKYVDYIKEKMAKLNEEICSSSNNYFFQYNQSQLPKSSKNIPASKREINLSELKNLKNSTKKLHQLNSPVTFHSINRQKNQKIPPNIEIEKHQLELMKEFNRKFQQRRLQNQKKLKFLLLKDKELDNFFNTLPKINLEKQQKSLIASENENSSILNNSYSYLSKQFNISSLRNNSSSVIYPQNQTLIKKLRKQLQQENLLSKLQEQFEKKKLKYERQFQGYDLDEALQKIMQKIFYDSKQKTQSPNLVQRKSPFVDNIVKKSQNFIKSSGIKQQADFIEISVKQANNLELKVQNEIQRGFKRSKQKQLTIDRSILKTSITQRQPSVNTKFAEKMNQLKKDQPYDLRKNTMSERNNKRQVFTSGNFRIKNSLNMNSIPNSSQIRQSLEKIKQKTSEKKLQQKNKAQRQTQANVVSFEDKVKDITDDVKQFIRVSVQNSQKTIKTEKIFVEKETNNIEDIFQSFNPKSNHNILINRNAPTSKSISRKSSTQQMSFRNFFGNDDLSPKSDHIIPSEFSIKYDEAAQLENLGKYSEAFDIYTELYKEFKEDYLKQMTLLGIAYNFELQKLYDQAQKTYLKCCKFNNAEAFMKLGQLLIRRNRIDQGIQNLQKANCIKRFDKQIQTKLVYGYSLKEETIQKALSLAHLVLKREPMSLQILIMTANILQKQSKIKEALQICLAIDGHKQSQFIKHYIGTLYLTQGNVVEAFKYFKSALQIKSDHVPSLIQIGTILSELKPKQAISILNKALDLQPDNRLALARLAKIFESIEDNPEKAMEIYRKTLETKSNYEAYMKIGNCLEVNGSYLEALVNYRQALNLKKTHTAFMKIAEMHEYKKQYKRSIENYQSALQIIPKQHKFYEERKKILINMAKDMLILQQFDNAITTLETLLEIEQSKEIYSMLGQGYFGKQEYSIALEFYQKANKVESEKDDIEILERLALCFDKKEQFVASRKIYERILELDPHNIKCINNYANILLIIGNTNEAFYWYEVMLQFCPKNIEKRMKVADIYSAVGDWSKVQYHLLICYKQKEHDIKVLEKLINLYKEKRQQKMVAKFQKKLNLLKVHSKKKEH